MQLMKKMKAPKKVERRKNAFHPVKFTSLLYLGEALHREQFEECPVMINIAFEFGASPKEVEKIISDYVRHDRSDSWNLGEF